MPQYKFLSQCNDFKRLLNCFSDDILLYFEEQLEAYENGSDERPAIVCWDKGMMDTDMLIEMCN